MSGGKDWSIHTLWTWGEDVDCGMATWFVGVSWNTIWLEVFKCCLALSASYQVSSQWMHLANVFTPLLPPMQFKSCDDLFGMLQSFFIYLIACSKLLVTYYSNQSINGQLPNWHSDWLTDWLTDCLTVDWLTDWLVDWLIEWLTDWLTDWLIDWRTDGRTDKQTDGRTDWLTDWLIMTDWLTVWYYLLPWVGLFESLLTLNHD